MFKILEATLPRGIAAVATALPALGLFDHKSLECRVGGSRRVADVKTVAEGGIPLAPFLTHLATQGIDWQGGPILGEVDHLAVAAITEVVTRCRKVEPPWPPQLVEQRFVIDAASLHATAGTGSPLRSVLPRSVATAAVTHGDYFAAANACPISAIKSSICSMPIESRTMSSLTPAEASSALLS